MKVINLNSERGEERKRGKERVRNFRCKEENFTLFTVKINFIFVNLIHLPFFILLSFKILSNNKFDY